MFSVPHPSPRPPRPVYKSRPHPRPRPATAPPFAWLVVPLLVVRPLLDTVLSMARIRMGSINTSPGFLFNAVLVGVAALLVAHAIMIDRRERGAVMTATIVWGPFLTAAAIALAHTPQLPEGSQVFFNYLTYAAVATIALAYAPFLDRARLTQLVALTATGPLLVGLYQLAAGTAAARLMACFTHPNILAFFLMTIIGYLYHAQISGFVRNRGGVAAIWLIIAVALVELLLTGTRSAYVATYAFLLIYSVARKPLYLVPLLLLPPIALLLPGVMDRVMNAANGAPDMTYSYLVSVSRGEISDSTSVQVDSGTWRRYLWASAWPWIERRPFSGYGLQSFAYYSVQFFALPAPGGSGAHNVYVQTIFEGGIPLLVGFIFMLASIMALSLLKLVSTGERIYVIVLTISYAIVCYSDNMLHYLIVNILFVGIVFSLIGRPWHLPERLIGYRQPDLLLGKRK